MKKTEFVRIVALLLGIAFIHYLLPRDRIILHVLFRFIYFLPIIYAALLAGKKGGIVTALVCTALFLPHFFITADHQFHAGNIEAIILFNLAGLGFGAYRDSIEKGYTAVRRQRYRKTKQSQGKRILFYLEQSSLNQIAANWLIDFLGDKSNTSINLLAITYEDVENLFEARAEAEKHAREMLALSETQLAETRKFLVEGGIPEEHIQTSLLKSSRMQRSSDKVLEEIQAGDYDFVLVGRHPVSKAQEFLKGDIAVRLTRDSPVPVMIIKGVTKNSFPAEG